ncbi:MAG: hypothetical protein FWD13_10675 [Treponema sp.]|nr:hypothetical protein [Treponema sp.]
MKFRLIYILVIISVFFLGCQKPPLAEMQNAKEAVFKAENDINAVLFAGNSLENARSALARMQSEADSKRYKDALKSAEEAIAAAERAIIEGKIIADSNPTISNTNNTTNGNISNGRPVTESDLQVLSNLKEEIEETSRNINGARYSNVNLDYDELDRAIINAYNTSDLAEADRAAGRYQDALDKAGSIRTALFNINQSVASAVTARKK